MSPAPPVRDFLQQSGISCRLVSHAPTESLEQAARAAQVPASAVARGVLLTDSTGPVLAILPLEHLLDFRALHDLLGRDLKPAPVEMVRDVFTGCAAGCVPPLPEAFSIPAVVDETLQEFDVVFFDAGRHDTLICVPGVEFGRLVGGDAGWGMISRHQAVLGGQPNAGDSQVADAHSLPVTGTDYSGLTPRPEISRCLEDVYQLPACHQALPTVLRFVGDTGDAEEQLVAALQSDPSVSGQALAFASCALSGDGRKPLTLADLAGARGASFTASLVAGVCIGKAFQTPPDGPVGLCSFWRQATTGLALAELLAGRLEHPVPEGPAITSLAVVARNIGYPLLAWMFPPEFFLLNRMARANARLPVTVLEKRVLGFGQARKMLELGHAGMGAWLLESWGVPDPVVVSVREHHNPDYQGPYKELQRLLLVVDYLLALYGTGDSGTQTVPLQAFQELGLDVVEAEQLTGELLEAHSRFDSLALHLAA